MRVVDLLRSFAVAGAILATHPAFAGFGIDALMFPAPEPTYGESLPGLEIIRRPDAEPVAVLRVAGPGTKTAVLYFHGNGEDLGGLRLTLEEFRDKTGCDIFAIDYPGYGLSGGEASEPNCYAAADSALALMQTKYGYKPEDIVLVGRSIGTGVATEMATRHPVKGLLLISPFTSAIRVVIKTGKLPSDRFENLAKIGRVTCPLLIVHGERDEVIPFAHGETLFAAAPGERKTFLAVPEGRHNTGIPGDKAEEYWYDVRMLTQDTTSTFLPVGAALGLGASLIFFATLSAVRRRKRRLP